MAAENFTTWTETDPGGLLSQTSSAASFAALLGNGTTNHLNVDKGASWKAGDFKFRFSATISGDASAPSHATNSKVNLLIVGTSAFAEFGEYFQSLRVRATTAGSVSTINFTLDRWASGNTTETPTETDTIASPASTGTRYYFEMERVSTTVTLKIYSDSGFSSLVDTLTVTESAATTLRYATVTATWYIGAATTISGDVSDLDFDYVAGGGGGSANPHNYYAQQ